MKSNIAIGQYFQVLRSGNEEIRTYVFISNASYDWMRWLNSMIDNDW